MQIPEKLKSKKIYSAAIAGVALLALAGVIFIIIVNASEQNAQHEEPPAPDSSGNHQGEVRGTQIYDTFGNTRM